MASSEFRLNCRVVTEVLDQSCIFWDQQRDIGVDGCQNLSGITVFTLKLTYLDVNRSDTVAENNASISSTSAEPIIRECRYCAWFYDDRAICHADYCRNTGGGRGAKPETNAGR